jgi:photosystem II stability/assembly factor-like uncharacterized protein
LLAVVACSRTADEASEEPRKQAPSASPGDELVCSARPAWKPRGAGGGGALFAPSINPHQEREVFVSSDMSGVYRSADFGRSWSMLPFYVMEGDRHAFVRFTSDARVMYALDFQQAPLGPARIIKSNDAGRTWDAAVTTPGHRADANHLLVDGASTERVLYADTHRLYFSSDGGRSFAEVHATRRSEGLALAGAHFAGRDIYVATSDGMLVSHDGGLGFALAPDAGIPAGESVVSFAAAQRGGLTRFFAVTYRNQDDQGRRTITPDPAGDAYAWFAGVYRLTLGEGDWTRTAVDLPANQKLSMAAMSLHDPDVVYLAGSERRPEGACPVVLKTEDGGQGWRPVFLSQSNGNIATGWSGSRGDADWDWGELALGLAVAPGDSRRVVLTDLGFVHVSEDGGRRWRQAYVDSRDQNPPGRATPKAKRYRSCGLEQTSCWWLTWSDPNTLFAAFTDITSAFSRDGGESWTRDGKNGLAHNTTYHVVAQPSTGVLYAATSSVHDLYQSPYLRNARIDGGTGSVMMSSDGGARWRLSYDFRRPVIWLALDPNRPNLLYASVVHNQSGGIYRVDLAHLDRPAIPLPAPPRTHGHPYNVHVLRDGSVLASYSGQQEGDTRVFTDRSGVFLLPPGGTAWQDRSSPEMHYWTKDLVVDPRNQDLWYVAVFTHDAGNFGGLYRTRDRGLHWQKIADNYRVESCAIDPRNPLRMYMTTQGEGLWLTENLDDEHPAFRQVQEYPFQQPMRVFWNPFDPDEVWTVSFGGGMHVARE